MLFNTICPHVHLLKGNIKLIKHGALLIWRNGMWSFLALCPHHPLCICHICMSATTNFMYFFSVPEIAQFPRFLIHPGMGTIAEIIRDGLLFLDQTTLNGKV